MYKRNQIEEAIALVIEDGSAKPSPTIRTRLKRLLETDRSLGRNKRSADPARANFAFYSKDAPGRGQENWFSSYEAFALMTGLRLMQHGWPQGFVVDVLRRIRPELEKEHARILTQDPAALFNEGVIRQRARPGDMAVDNTDPVFLGLVSPNQQGRASPIDAAICRGQVPLMDFLRSHGPGQTLTTYELANSAHALWAALADTIPRKRGRSTL